MVPAASGATSGPHGPHISATSRAVPSPPRMTMRPGRGSTAAPRSAPMDELPAPRPRRLLAKFTGVALIGFGVSAVILHLGLEAGLRPWAARLIALLFAMNVTFLVNGRFVFRALTRQRFFA